jgi:predicted MFS family arabinose efflux permease
MTTQTAVAAPPAAAPFTAAPAAAGPSNTATGTASRERLMSRALGLRCVSIVGSSIGFYLPLSVVPLFAQQSGSDSDAGLATVALLLTSVACELVTPRLVEWIGYRWALVLGLTLLGAPSVALTMTDSAWAVLLVSVIRGAGFAICVVAGGAVTARLIPASRRGEGLALVGLVGGVPGLIALPAGVWAAHRWGFSAVFVATTVATLVTLGSVPGLPRRTASAAGGGESEDAHGVLAGLRNPVLTSPAVIFAASTVAVGVLVTFLPLACSGQPTWVVAAALLAQPAASMVARWFAGRVCDTHGPARLLGPGLLLSAVGMALIALTAEPAAVIGGALVFGVGFGVLQNATLTLMYARAPAGGEGAVSAIWNAAYDLGMAAGALGAGLVVASVGYSAVFVLTAVVVLPALVLVQRDRRPER